MLVLAGLGYALTFDLSVNDAGGLRFSPLELRVKCRKKRRRFFEAAELFLNDNLRFFRAKRRRFLCSFSRSLSAGLSRPMPHRLIAPLDAGESAI